MGAERGDAVTVSPRSTVRRIAAHEYRFQSQWTFGCDFADAVEVLSRLEDYAQWWPQVTRSERDGEAGRAVVHLRSALPFTLRLRLDRDVEDRAGGRLRANVGGDIEGFVSWTVTREPAGTHVQFDQDVTLRHPVARRVDIIARPVLQWNHAVAMRGCARGLLHQLPVSSGR